MICCGSYVYNWKGFEIWTLLSWIVTHYSTIVSEIPNLAKSSCKNLIVSLHVGFLHFITSGHLKKLSTTKYCPFIGPAKSMCSLDQGLCFRPRSKFHWWCLCCYCAISAGFYIFFYFFYHIQPKNIASIKAFILAILGWLVWQS